MIRLLDVFFITRYSRRRQVLDRIDRELEELAGFKVECQALEYTDTGEAWQMIDRLARALEIARKELIS
jgi:short-subunit dehydrogenase